MAVNIYPLAPFVETVISCAAIFATFVSVAVGELDNVPRFTSEAEAFIPVLVVSVWRQPVVLLLLTADPLAIPVIVKVSDGSIFARTVTDSTVPIEMVDVSRLFAPSVVVILTFHISDEPAVWLLFVGLISVGTWVLQFAPLFAEHPMRIVTTVPAVTAAVVTVQVIVGELIENVQAADPAEKSALILPVERLLKANVLAEGDALLSADPGKFITIVPLIGIVVALVN